MRKLSLRGNRIILPVHSGLALEDGEHIKNASLHGCNLLGQRRSSCRGAMFKRQQKNLASMVVHLFR